MPRTERQGRHNKKRGKKGSKKNDQIEAMEDVQQLNQQQEESHQVEQHFQAAHFGELDEEMLGYFKNVEETLDDPQFETGEGKEIKLKCGH